MWQFVLAAAAVAGSTCLAAKHFLKQTPQCNDEEEQVPTTPSSEYGPSSAPKKPVMDRQGSKNGVRITKVELRSVAEVRTVESGNRWPLCFKKRRRIKNIDIPGKNAFTSFKKRKTINNIPGNAVFCSSKGYVNVTYYVLFVSAFFDSGVRFGIMCMMAGKAEINELTKTMDNTVKIVEELKSELILTKSSSRPHHVLDYVDNNIGMEYCKMSGRDDEIMLKKKRSELRDSEAKFWSLPVIDNGDECERSAPTEDSDPLVLEMDQLGVVLVSGQTYPSP